MEKDKSKSKKTNASPTHRKQLDYQQLTEEDQFDTQVQHDVTQLETSVTETSWTCTNFEESSSNGQYDTTYESGYLSAETSFQRGGARSATSNWMNTQWTEEDVEEEDAIEYNRVNNEQYESIGADYLTDYEFNKYPKSQTSDDTGNNYDASSQDAENITESYIPMNETEQQQHIELARLHQIEQALDFTHNESRRIKLLRQKQVCQANIFALNSRVLQGAQNNPEVRGNVTSDFNYEMNNTYYSESVGSHHLGESSPGLGEDRSITANDPPSADTAAQQISQLFQKNSPEPRQSTNSPSGYNYSIAIVSDLIESVIDNLFNRNAVTQINYPMQNLRLDDPGPSFYHYDYESTQNVLQRDNNVVNNTTVNDDRNAVASCFNTVTQAIEQMTQSLYGDSRTLATCDNTNQSELNDLSTFDAGNTVGTVTSDFPDLSDAGRAFFSEVTQAIDQLTQSLHDDFSTADNTNQSELHDFPASENTINLPTAMPLTQRQKVSNQQIERFSTISDANGTVMTKQTVRQRLFLSADNQNETEESEYDEIREQTSYPPTSMVAEYPNDAQVLGVQSSMSASLLNLAGSFADLDVANQASGIPPPQGSFPLARLWAEPVQHTCFKRLEENFEETYRTSREMYDAAMKEMNSYKPGFFTNQNIQKELPPTKIPTAKDDKPTAPVRMTDREQALLLSAIQQTKKIEQEMLRTENKKQKEAKEKMKFDSEDKSTSYEKSSKLTSKAKGLSQISRSKSKKDTSDETDQLNYLTIFSQNNARLKDIKQQFSLKMSAIRFQWLSLVARPEVATMTAYKENSIKNIPQNVGCYDHTRVKLQYDPNEAISNSNPDPSYIHANYVHGYKQRRRYICCQAPFPGVIKDFWRMIWQNDVRVIVIIASQHEAMRFYTYAYYPLPEDKEKVYGNYRVTYLDRKSGENYSIRIYSMESKTGETRRIYQMRFEIFRPGLYPSRIFSFLNFIQQVRQYQATASLERLQNGSGAGGESPIVIHSNVGLDDTGLFTCLDICTQLMDDTGKVNIMEVAQIIMQQRAVIFDHFYHYLFCYQALLDYAIMQGYLPDDACIDGIAQEWNE